MAGAMPAIPAAVYAFERALSAVRSAGLVSTGVETIQQA
jgi:hypothetical protein